MADQQRGALLMKGPKRCKDGALGPATGHASLRVTKAQVVGSRSPRCNPVVRGSWGRVPPRCNPVVPPVLHPPAGAHSPPPAAANPPRCVAPDRPLFVTAGPLRSPPPRHDQPSPQVRRRLKLPPPTGCHHPAPPVRRSPPPQVRRLLQPAYLRCPPPPARLCPPQQPWLCGGQPAAPPAPAAWVIAKSGTPAPPFTDHEGVEEEGRAPRPRIMKG